MTTPMSQKRVLALKNFYAIAVLAVALLMGGTARAAWDITWDNFSQPVYGYQSYCAFTYPSTCADCYIYSYSDYQMQCSARDSSTCTRCHWETTYTVVDWTRLPDRDAITYTIERGVADPAVVEFRLIASPHITWWKEINFGGWKVWTQDGKSWCNWPYASTANCNTNSEWASVITAPGATVIFSKAKEWGIHRQMYVLRNLGARLQGGDRVTFHWREDN